MENAPTNNAAPCPLLFLTAARKYRGLTQKQLSELSGVAQSDISQIENGTLNPSLKILKRLAYAMNMTMEISFEPIENPAPLE